MQQVMRPYATAGIALVGATMIAVVPMAAPMPGVQTRSVRLVDAISDLITETTANYQNIVNGADSSAISELFGQLSTNPLGVLDALSNLTPTVTSDLTSLPGTISVQLPPGLELAIAELGSTATTFNAISSVIPELQTNPSSAFEALATILNGYLNGQDNISLLDGTINVAGFNGILAPLQDVSVNLNLTNLIDALGLGNTSLSNLDLSSLLSQLGLGDLNLGSLFSDLGLSGKGLGDLLGDPSLGTLLSDLGLGGLLSTDGLGLGSFSLTTLLTDLGLNTDLSSLTNVGGVHLGTLLGELGLISPLATDLNGVLSGLLGPEETALNTALALIPPLNSLSISDLVSPTGLTTALNDLTLGNNNSLDLTTLLNDLGLNLPNPLNITDLLQALGVTLPSTGPLTLAGLLGDLNIDNLSVGSLLNTVNLGDLLGDLGLSKLPLDLTNLGDLSGLTLGGLLGDLGLGNIADISVQPIGGLATELVDVVPQQILASLGM